MKLEVGKDSTDTTGHWTLTISRRSRTLHMAGEVMWNYIKSRFSSILILHFPNRTLIGARFLQNEVQVFLGWSIQNSWALRAYLMCVTSWRDAEWSRQSKISQFHGTRCLDKNILGFQIAVHHTMGVTVRKGSQHLPQETLENFKQWESAG